MLMRSIIAAAAAASSLAIADRASAAIVLTSGSPSYGQNFNTLVSNNTSSTDYVQDPAIDGQYGLAGWYGGYSTSATPAIASSAGGSATGRLYSFGSTTSVNGAGDRTLGSVATGTPGDITYGVRFVNNTGTTITGFTMGYSGEQWRVADKTGASTANEQIVPGYAIFDANTGSVNATGVYVAAPAASRFDTPVDTIVGAGTIDGNSTAAGGGKVAGLSWTVTGISVADGRELWIRFFDADSTGTDHGLGVDDFTFAATLLPEPATLVATLGAAAVTLVRRRRR